jgi:hypothetical protein
VLKGPAAIARYGEKGKNGVLEIFTKTKGVHIETIESNVQVDNIISEKIDSIVEKQQIDNQIQVDNIIFEKVEIDPLFPSVDPVSLASRQQAISEIKAIAKNEGKAAYIYKGRTYIFARINNPDPTIATFAEQDGTNHFFLLNGELVHSIDEINKRFSRNDVVKLSLISKQESLKRFNIKDLIVSIETYDINAITKR